MLPPDFDATLRRFLAEDLRSGDVTAESLLPGPLAAEATLLAKAEGVICGADLAERVVRLLDPDARARDVLRDGEKVTGRRVVATIAGDGRALLAAERTLLNLVQRMSGIATLTARFVAAVAGTGAAIVDTRKTAPGLRWFDKRAVAAGGGVNHRLGLHDQVLVKSNHLALALADASRGGRRPIEEAIAAARAKTKAHASSTAAPAIPIAIEVFDAAEALRAAAAGAGLVLLDNLAPAGIADVVKQVRARFAREQVVLEASGGVTLANVRAYAEAGVDRISIGALTHSAPALDLSLVVAPPGVPGPTP